MRGILDNLSAHKAPPVERWLLKHPRFHLHFTPTYASWLDLVERFFAQLTDEALRRGTHTSIPQLRKAIYEHVEVHDDEGRPFTWTKTADEILDKVRELPDTTEAVQVNGPGIGPVRLVRVEHEDGAIEVVAIDTRESGSLRRLMETPAVEWSYEQTVGSAPIEIDVDPAATAPLKLF